MKVALVLAAPWIPGSVDMTEYLRQLHRLGHEPVLICQDRSAGPPGHNVIAADRDSMQDPDFYEKHHIDAAIAFTWFNYPRIITALTKSGAKVLIRGDSDGLLSIRQFPAHHWRVRMSVANSAATSLAATKHLLQRYLFDYRGEDRHRLESLAAADISVLETAEAAGNVSGFLRWQNRPDLVERLRVVPHFVADDFLTCDLNPSRGESVVAIGRWEDPQKNAPLLAGAIELHLAKYPATQFSIIGGEAGRVMFRNLTAKYPQVTYTGPQNPAGVRKYLADARVLLSASRWEGSPVVGNEALAMGAAVVGTPIPAFFDICRRGNFGTVSVKHNAVSLAAALDSEWQHWNNGNRRPASIADYWRPQLSAETVVSALTRLLLGKPSKQRAEAEEMQTA